MSNQTLCEINGHRWQRVYETWRSKYSGDPVEIGSDWCGVCGEFSPEHAPFRDRLEGSAYLSREAHASAIRYPAT
jgi:hypothetical protein